MRHSARPLPAPPRALAAALLVAAAGLALAPPLAAQEVVREPDPFYVDLLHEGRQAYEEGHYAQAARDLRLACFGLLENPPALGACLSRLAIAQAAAEDREGFTETFRRLTAVERRFGGYRRAELPEEVQRELEQRLIRWIPAEQLDEVAAFSPLADRQRAAALARLPPAKRREELAGLIAAEPDNAVWRLVLAELELEEENPVAAAVQAEAVLAADPAAEAALCLRGLVRAEQGACSGAVADLAGCGRARGEERFAQAFLSCRVTLGQGAEATAFYGSLPPELRESRRLARLAREAERLASAAPQEAPAAEAALQAEESESAGNEQTAEAAGGGDAAPAGDPARLTPAEQEQLSQARRMLRETRYASDLEEPLRLAREVADAHPGLAEAQHLAGQIAYRASRWQEAAGYFRRGGDPGDGEPVLLFYMAVSYYEVGDRPAAAEALRRALPHLERTPFVSRYVEAILGQEDTSRAAADREPGPATGSGR